MAETQIYFIAGGGKTKIGCARNPERRMQEMQVGSPEQLRLVYQTPGGFVLERLIIESLASKHSHGEWFHGEMSPGEAAATVAVARERQPEARSSADVGEAPMCECHGEPMYWAKMSRRRHGGYWRCAVRHRESSKRSREKTGVS